MGKKQQENTAVKGFARIPEPTLRRLPWYLSCARLIQARGARFVSSTTLSRETGIDVSQIAKDLSFVRVTGKTRVGYEVSQVVEVLDNVLGFTGMHRAFLFGVGNLGAALLADNQGLRQFGLDIVAAFDVDARLIGTDIRGVPIFHSDEFPQKMLDYDVQIGVLTVPVSIAQQVTDQMVEGGIKAVWNFTPFRICVPRDIVVQNTSLYARLALIYNRLNSK